MVEGFIEDRSKPPQHSQEYLNGVYRCGQRNKHEVRIHRAQWPPAAHANLNDRPHLDRTCENCGGQVIVYDPPDRSVTVILYGEPGERDGKVVEETIGAVLDESAVPAGGQVLEEPEMPKRGRR